MRVANDCAPTGCTVQARSNTKSSDTTRVSHPVDDAQAGKVVAVWLYCIGARSLSATQAIFARHPEWVSA